MQWNYRAVHIFRRCLIEINIKQIPNGKWKEICYVVSNLNGDALIIDPGDAEKSISNFIDDKEFDVRAIINTHAHYDHVGAVKYLKDKYSAPFFLDSRDEKLLKSANLYVKIFEGENPIKIPTVDYYLDKIKFCNLISGFSIQVLFTPGHTFGSVCFLIDDCLFTGDTLFNGKIGRTDLPGGDDQFLKESLKIISKLPCQTNIFPGHGTSSTIGNELKYNNSFIQALQ